jgi:acyl-CoA reductase-like NAD-dependent aldehyde dehydrogenase
MGPTTITPRPKRRSSSFTSNLFRQRTDGFEGDGFKQSGVGGELGPDALDHYTELKNVFLSTT